MLVKGAGNFLNQQPTKKQTRSRSADDKSFEKALGRSMDDSQVHKKKKPMQKIAKKPIAKDKKTNEDSFDEGQKQFRSEDKPKKLLSTNGNTKEPVSKINGQKENLGQKENQGLLKQSSIKELNNMKSSDLTGAGLSSVSTVQEEGVLIEKASQVVDSQKINKENLLSINSSDSKIKTLKENIEKLEKFEKSFSDYVNKDLKEAISQQKTLGGMNNGNLELSKEMKAETSVKTIQMNDSQEFGTAAGLQGLKLNDFKNDGGASGESSDMNSMFVQGLEQESQVNNSDSSSFVEAMAEVDQGQNGEKIENMQSIIKQARAIVKDGGGSMQIEMTPEGMGKLHLKVDVQDGQVNVEMLADNMNAKKALEDGLAEIKMALEGQKLIVDTLKVEMADDYQKDFSDLRDHMQEQENRDFAEQFLGQFRQEKDAKYGSMFDGFRNFNRGPKEPELHFQTKRNNPYAENGKGRTLNVVA